MHTKSKTFSTEGKVEVSEVQRHLAVAQLGAQSQQGFASIVWLDDAMVDYISNRPEAPTDVDREVFAGWFNKETFTTITDADEGYGVQASQFAKVPTELVEAAGYDADDYFATLSEV